MVVSTSPSAPLIVVFGATGKQGGSVIDHLAASKREYRIKGVTRSASKLKETKLAEPKLQVIEADLMSKDGVTNAIEGANAVFVNPHFLHPAPCPFHESPKSLSPSFTADVCQPLVRHNLARSWDRGGASARCQHNRGNPSYEASAVAALFWTTPYNRHFQREIFQGRALRLQGGGTCDAGTVKPLD